MSADRNRWGELEADAREAWDPHGVIPEDFPYTTLREAMLAIEPFGAHFEDPR